MAGALQAADFPLLATGAIGNEPRNAFRGPGFKNVDLSLFKNFRLNGVGAGDSTRAGAPGNVQRLQLGEPEQPGRAI